eukprot:COSAG01_NODE_56444_length_318_cov_0.945205_2_plen_24_part_01
MVLSERMNGRLDARFKSVSNLRWL